MKPQLYTWPLRTTVWVGQDETGELHAERKAG